jgi:hypothetical protein
MSKPANAEIVVVPPKKSCCHILCGCRPVGVLCTLKWVFYLGIVGAIAAVVIVLQVKLTQFNAALKKLKADSLAAYATYTKAVGGPGLFSKPTLLIISAPTNSSFLMLFP